MKAPAGQYPQLEFRVLFRAHWSCWQNSVTYSCRSEAVPLPAGDQLSVPTSTLRFQPWALRGSLLHQNHQENILLQSGKTKSHNNIMQSWEWNPIIFVEILLIRSKPWVQPELKQRLKKGMNTRRQGPLVSPESSLPVKKSSFSENVTFN